MRDRSEKDRIDLVARIPVRSKVKIASDGGAIDVVGNFELAERNGYLGTYMLSAAFEALQFKFLWQAKGLGT